MVALSTYKILYSKNISVPDQVQLIGFDDIMWANLFTPALTTISQPIHNIATRAMELIMDEDILKGEYIGFHPCINTSSLRLKTADLMEKVIPAMGHEPRIVAI